jgi:site-specific recombinase XerD
VLRFIALMEARYPRVRRFSDVRRHPHVEAWLGSIRDRHPVTRHNYMEILDQFFEDLIDWEWPEAPPRRLILETDFPLQPKHVPKPFDPQSDRRLQEVFGQQDSVMGLGLSVLRQTGLRVGELLALPLDAMSWTREGLAELKVPPGKTNTERLFPLSRQTAELIESIRRRRGLNVPDRDLPPLLMVDEQGRPVRYWTYRRYIKRLAQRAQIPHWQKATLHRLRHTFATELARTDIPLPSLMRLLGHRRPDVTMRYVELTSQDIRRTYDQALARLRDAPSPACVLKTVSRPRHSTVLADFQTLVARLDHQRRDTQSAAARADLARLVKRMRAALRAFHQCA